MGRSGGGRQRRRWQCRREQFCLLGKRRNALVKEMEKYRNALGCSEVRVARRTRASQINSEGKVKSTSSPVQPAIGGSVTLRTLNNGREGATLFRATAAAPTRSEPVLSLSVVDCLPPKPKSGRVRYLTDKHFRSATPPTPPLPPHTQSWLPTSRQLQANCRPVSTRSRAGRVRLHRI